MFDIDDIIFKSIPTYAGWPPEHGHNQVDHLTMCTATRLTTWSLSMCAATRLTTWLCTLWLGWPSDHVICDQVDDLTMCTVTTCRLIIGPCDLWPGWPPDAPRDYLDPVAVGLQADPTSQGAGEGIVSLQFRITSVLKTLTSARLK